MNLHNKIIIITGAGGGIGAALASCFLQQAPEFILLLDVQLELIQVEAIPPTIIEAARCDVSNASEIQTHVNTVLERFGRIDLFCSNAGVFKDGGADAGIASWQQSLDINLMAHVYAAEACLPSMLAQGSGYFLQTISAAGLLSQIGSAPYTVSKHAALGFAEWLAISYGEQGIGVTALCSQGVATAMLDDIVDVNSVTSDGLVSPEEVAECALQAIKAKQFLALPHPSVRHYYQGKAADHDKWITGMQKFQARLNTMPNQAL